MPAKTLAKLRSPKRLPVSRGGDPKPFSVEYACAKLGISVPTFYELMNSGKLRTYVVGSRGRRVSDEAIADCRRLLESEAAAKRIRTDISAAQRRLSALMANVPDAMAMCDDEPAVRRARVITV